MSFDARLDCLVAIRDHLRYLWTRFLTPARSTECFVPIGYGKWCRLLVLRSETATLLFIGE